MSFEPRQKNKAPDVFMLAMFVCAAVAAGFSSWDGLRGRGFLQGMVLVLFGLLIFVLVRYKMTRIRYTVRMKTVKKGYGSEDDDDTVPAYEGESGERPITSIAPEKLEFIVEKAQSRNTFVTECLVELNDIVFCKPYSTVSKEEQKKIKAEAGKSPTYKYVKNMVGASTWLMCVKTPQGKAKIIFESSAKMGEYLSAVAGYNNSNK